MKPTHAAAICAMLIVSLFCVTSGAENDHYGQNFLNSKTRHSEAAEEVVYGQEGDKPEVVIEAPAKVKVGDMIVIDLSGSIGGGFDVIVMPELPSARLFDDGKVIVSGTGYKTQEYLVIVSCALDGASDVKTHVIKVVGTQPAVPDNPGRDIPSKVLSWCDGVDSPTPRDDALKLAQSFASLATVIENDTFADTREVIAATKTSNRDALGTNLEYWVPLLDGLMGELKAMAAAGMLPDAQAHGPVWRAVSEGLKAYAEQLAG
jgi:hypothetical protein